MRRGWAKLVEIPDTESSHVFLSRLAANGIPTERLCVQPAKTRPAFVDGGHAAYPSHLDLDDGFGAAKAADFEAAVAHVVIESAHYTNRVPRVLAPLRYDTDAAVWAAQNYDPNALESMLALSEEDSYREIIVDQYRKATHGRS